MSVGNKMLSDWWPKRYCDSWPKRISGNNKKPACAGFLLSLLSGLCNTLLYEFCIAAGNSPSEVRNTSVSLLWPKVRRDTPRIEPWMPRGIRDSRLRPFKERDREIRFSNIPLPLLEVVHLVYQACKQKISYDIPMCIWQKGLRNVRNLSSR